MADTQRDLLDEDGENRALRSFLMQYGLPGLTVGAMRDHMKRSGWGGEYWPFFVSASNRDTHLTKGGAQVWIRHLLGMEAASRPAEVDDKRHQDLIDVFDLTWNVAVESAAFYVDGHCADGAHHVEHILELVPPKIVVGGVTVAEVRARRAKADAELWDAAMSHAAAYVENHCLYGTEHADHIKGMKRPDFGAAPLHTTNKEK